MNILDSSGNPTSEEFHYQYDQLGRITSAAFAQTPQSGQTGYTNSYPAANRAKAFYLYDNGGRLENVSYVWENWNGSSYDSQAVLANTCGYETTGSQNRGLKRNSVFWTQNPSNPAVFMHEWTEYYDYDTSLDYLVSATYLDGQPNANQYWSYDAAGNRSDATCDNLNRATSIGGVARTYDILGNTLTKGSSVSMGWDSLNRMTSYNSSSTSASYTYRADGMRTKKVVGSTTTRFAYDGQMPVETWDGTTVTRQALGARGIDWTQATTSSGSSVSYPIYDAHGNNVASLSKSGSSYSLSGRRSYGAWGEIRQGATTGGSTSRYCASIGHVDDDESELTYIRARYYESASGRFASEDPARDGVNFFAYCENDPISKQDYNGCNSLPFQIGDYWVRLDRFYTCGPGSQQMADWTWGFTKECEMGSIRYIGTVNHGVAAPDELVQLLVRNDKFCSWVRRAEQHCGMANGYGIGMTTLDATFMADPFFVIELFSDIGQGMSLLGNQRSRR
jgi:RHS repeat-associated protein